MSGPRVLPADLTLRVALAGLIVCLFAGCGRAQKVERPQAAAQPPTSCSADGYAGAPVGVPPQLPNLLDGYALRSPCHVAGVDYGVGPDRSTVFFDSSQVADNGYLPPADATPPNSSGCCSACLSGTLPGCTTACSTSRNR